MRQATVARDSLVKLRENHAGTEEDSNVGEFCGHCIAAVDALKSMNFARIRLEKFSATPEALFDLLVKDLQGLEQRELEAERRKEAWFLDVLHYVLSCAVNSAALFLHPYSSCLLCFLLDGWQWTGRILPVAPLAVNTVATINAATSTVATPIVSVEAIPSGNAKVGAKPFSAPLWSTSTKCVPCWSSITTTCAWRSGAGGAARAGGHRS